jgi:hypothetical protein
VALKSTAATCRQRGEDSNFTADHGHYRPANFAARRKHGLLLLSGLRAKFIGGLFDACPPRVEGG